MPRPGRGCGDEIRRSRGSARRGHARPGPCLRDPARWRALRAGNHAQLFERHRGEPDPHLGRLARLQHHSRRPGLPPLPPQYRDRDDWIAGARHRARDRGGPGVPCRLPRQARRAVRAAVAVGGPRVARRHRLDVDLRFDLQRDQLDAQGDRAAPRLALLARRTGPRAVRDHHRAGVAHFPVRDRDRPRGALVDSAGRGRGVARGRRGLLATALQGRAAAPASRDRRRRLGRRSLHRHRPRRRIHSDWRWTREYHARAAHPRVPARRAGCRPRPRRGDRGVPRAVSDRGRRPHAAGRPPDRSRRGRDRRAMKRVPLYAAALGFIVFAGFPFYWMFITAFKQNRDLYVGAFDTRHVPWIFNDPPTFEHVRLLFGQTDFLRWVANTLLVIVAVVIITVALAVPAGYSLARLVGRWGGRLGMGIFFTYLIPPTLLFIPFSRVIALLGLQNSLGALILVYPTITVPFCTWLVMGFVRSVPWDIEEQAMIDGYSRLAVIIRIAPRLILPGILTVVVFTFTLVMQEFVYALTFISSVDRMTVSLGVPIALVRGDVYHWGSLMAAALFTSIPLAILYNLFIDRFIQGFTMGAVKG